MVSIRWHNEEQAKSVCIPSSQLMSSLENVRPGMRPHFLSRKTGTRKNPRRRYSYWAESLI
ncbi:uncharacterized protein HD556DRAFT_1244377 [Suillus plorans]|uniref:Uncharacterized protein n=1 Tax=Suillus plorans TaxID=116603 RepID=A0A9P7AGI8_9AGAM|nr:uncharacterized protein HD556DRAFT_1244377 [Suillus plorans]KAG1789009.1 hypothetical protein HD556DRAFT_1244377 [Suillus plorans]